MTPAAAAVVIYSVQSNSPSVVLLAHRVPRSAVPGSLGAYQAGVWLGQAPSGSGQVLLSAVFPMVFTVDCLSTSAEVPLIAGCSATAGSTLTPCDLVSKCFLVRDWASLLQLVH